MPALGPVSRTELIAYLRRIGFDGPFPGDKHELMTRGPHHLILPNPHRGAIGPGFVRGPLRQGHISRAEWEAL